MSPASGAFRYIGPAGERPSLTVVREGDETVLSAVLRRLLPVTVTVRFDRRVDGGRAVARVYADWRSLLWGEGLAYAEHRGEIHVRPAGLAAGDVVLVSGSQGEAVWEIEAGEGLREALARWGNRAGVEVMFLTDRRYRIGERREFAGTFEQALRGLLFGLSHLPHPPAGELSADGRSLSVMHRSSRVRAPMVEGDGS